jgi:hypothetical protein
MINAETVKRGDAEINDLCSLLRLFDSAPLRKIVFDLHSLPKGKK